MAPCPAAPRAVEVAGERLSVAGPRGPPMHTWQPTTHRPRPGPEHRTGETEEDPHPGTRGGGEQSQAAPFQKRTED